MPLARTAEQLWTRGEGGGGRHPRQILKPRVALVDGQAGRREATAAAMLPFYQVVSYPDTVRAYVGMRVAPPEVVVMDERAPPHDAFEFTRRLRRDPDLRSLPVIIVAHQRSDLPALLSDCGADGSLPKPFRRAALVHAISQQINRRVEGHWEDLPEIQHRALKGTVEAFRAISDDIDRGEPIVYASISDACQPLVEAVNENRFRTIMEQVRHHDDYSYAHSLRVATLLALFGYTVGLRPDEQNILASGGLLHDVGKLFIPEEVLNKPTRLTPAEYEVMKGHVTHSVEYLKASGSVPRGVLIIAGQHHEKLNGTGYPQGLKGGQLNELARMASIVDVFSALTDRRCYKAPFDPEQALKVMTEDMADRHLDRHFLRLFRETLLDAASEVKAREELVDAIPDSLDDAPPGAGA